MANPQKQAMLTLAQVLLKSRAAEKTLTLLPSQTPTSHYTNIKQLPNENIIHFYNCLCEAVSSQVPNPDLPQALLLELLQVNTNDACKQVILTLPLHPAPTVESIL